MKLSYKKYISWFLLLGMFFALLGCNGTSNTVPSSSLKAITAFSFPSSNGPVNGVISGQNIAVTMPYGTDVTSLVATFTTSGASVHVGSTAQTSGSTPNNFTSPVSYVVTAEDGSTATYTVTVVNNLYFAPYYPANCVLGSNCDCVQDTTTHDVWTVTTSGNNQCYNSLMDVNGTCPGYPTPSVKGYIPNLNSNNTCGFSSGWNLPTNAQLTTMAGYVSGESNGSKGTWFNSHGFSGINNNGIYWGQCANTSCTLPSGASGNAWAMNLYLGAVGSVSQGSSSSDDSGWGVHSGL